MSIIYSDTTQHLYIYIYIFQYTTESCTQLEKEEEKSTILINEKQTEIAVLKKKQEECDKEYRKQQYEYDQLPTKMDMLGDEENKIWKEQEHEVSGKLRAL